MHLRPGANVLTFTVEGSAASVSSTLFLWGTHAKIIISDVDGTITKSDMLGHLFYYLGRDWTHAGVAQLFSNIRDNGYEFVYLTSRATSSATATVCASAVCSERSISWARASKLR